MDVADIPVMIIVGHVEGRRAARGIDVGLASTTQRVFTILEIRRLRMRQFVENAARIDAQSEDQGSVRTQGPNTGE